ncbi:MAG: hypothetical protein A3F11_10195 [Gammaproteobacteria bacterium RIFCSPHIGHO2_12_FULL_37_14]|nr:MAG: hypothetical protein A3F11_10195 [Gammaproteobacteria bacterium RIFCSPHIGHO2_12_FULL_37_14]
MKIIYTAALVLCSSLFFMISPVLGYPSFEKEMKNLQSQLEKIQPQLNGSIILIDNEKDKFAYSSNNVSDKSQFYIGSLTKQFTAFIFLNLLHKKHPSEDIEKLLNRKLSEEFPDSNILKSLDKSWVTEISLLDLLTHRSGLSDYIEAYVFQLKQPELLSKPIDAKSILQVVSFDPEKNYRYSNTNYFLLGKLIEEMQGENFDQAFNTLIKTPAKMDFSYAPTQDNFHMFIQENRFQNLVPDMNKEIFIDVANAIGTGNIISTSEDLLSWNKYLYSESNAEIRKIMLKGFFQDEDGDIVNLGLTTSQTNFGPLIGFQGGQDSYHSFLGYLPSHKLNIVILSNNTEDFEKLMGIFINFLQSDLTKTKKVGSSLFFRSKTKEADTVQVLNQTQSNNLK